MRHAILAVLLAAGCAAQMPQTADSGASPNQQQPPAQASTAAPLTIDLQDAIKRAREYSPQFLAASTAADLARESRFQAKAAFLPTVGTLNQYIYTQGNGTPSGVFVANDGVHIYNEQLLVHGELFSMAKLAQYRGAVAAQTAAQARRDIAARGLVYTVVQSYYTLASTQRMVENAKRGVAEAEQFLDITRKQEAGGEAAHVDVVKAELQVEQRRRDLRDAEANAEQAKLALAVMLFPNVNQPFSIVDDMDSSMPLPPMNEVRVLASENNPEIRAAEAGLREAVYGVKAAKSAYYPTLDVQYFFGIDANVFGIHGPEDRKNLGSALQATLNVPIWDWGSTRSKIHQAELLRRQAQSDAGFARRQLEANTNGLYLEAETARQQLQSLHSSLDLANQNLRLTVLQYEAGEAAALEVVSAEDALTLARNAYDGGLVRYRVALANLQTLTGRF